MANLKEFLDDIKPIKYWHVKDTYYYQSEIGNHWFFKKFVTFYKNFLVNDSDVSSEAEEEVKKKFLSFCNTIDDPNKKKEALNYFFNPTDFRKKLNIINFKDFNNLDGKEDLANNLYLLRLLGIGGQFYEKKKINNMLQNNKTMLEIHSNALTLLKEGNKERQKNKIKITGASASASSILRDQVGPIRNYRQTFTLWGFLPNEEDGYELNEISELIYETDDELLIAALGDHQKFKMKLGRVEPELIYLKHLKKRNPENFFSKSEDFNDFEVLPSIALIEVLKELEKITQPYLNFDEYNFIINRLSPFNLKKAIELIKSIRANGWPKDFEKNNFGGNGDPKQLTNFCYGNNLKKGNKIFNEHAIIEYNDSKLKIVDSVKFDYYYKFILIIKNYLSKKYKKLYEEFGEEFKRNLVVRIDSTSIDKNYIKKIKNYVNYKREKIENFEDDPISKWKNYTNKLDVTLLILTYTLNYCLINFEKIKKNPKNLKINLPKSLENKIEKTIFTTNIKQLVSAFLNKEADFDISKLLKSNYVEKLNEFNLEELIKTSSTSEILDILKKQNKHNLVFFNDQIIRKRNINLMNFARLEREKSIIQGSYNNKINKLECDVCNKIVSDIKKLDCHHILPFEINGPDTLYNYSFVCKTCHNKFSHDPNHEKRVELINQLKLKNLINRENYISMIKDKDLKKFHLDYLLNKKYIHYVQYLEFIKFFNEKIYRKQINSWNSKIGTSIKRWSRAMTTSKKKFNTTCQGKPSCKNTNIETHHIIPKTQRIPRHGNKILKGPESPYNYAFLCKKCHDAFDKTNSLTESQKIIIKEFKIKRIISIESVYQMILDDGLNFDQLDFLKVDNYINQDDYIWLKEKIELRDYYRSN